MNSTYSYLTSHRAWFVPSVSVWGALAADTIAAAATEVDDSQTRVVFDEFALGGEVQELIFADLVDHRGNSLPGTIDAPAVILVPKNQVPVAIVGTPSPTSVRLAKTIFAPENALVDLWIIEARS
jgi:hypothetical protein